MRNIDITKIDREAFSIKCSQCNTTRGAVIQCQHGKCQNYFHPLCIKNKLTKSKNSSYDEKSLFCIKHKPLKLKKIIENKEKKTIENIMSFARLYEKMEQKFQKVEPIEIPNKKTQIEKAFTYKERAELLELIDERLKREQKKGFNFLFKPNQPQKSLRCKIEVNKPDWFTLLDPSIITAEKLSIEGRKYDECFKTYVENILPLLKREIKVLEYPHSIFKLNKPKKRPRNEKKDSKISATTYINKPIMEDILSQELHCICKSPFVEAAPQRSWETDEDYNKRIAKSEMILCDQCESWFHLSCLGIKPFEIPEQFFCASCQPKRVEVCIDYSN